MLFFVLMTVESEDDRSFLIDLYQQHYRLLVKEAGKLLHNHHDAEDVVQDFFAYVASHIKKFREIECCRMRYFLVMCIRRRSIDALRKRGTIKKHIIGSIDNEKYAFEYEDTDMNIENVALDRLEVSEMKKAFLKIPEKMQNILEYKYLLKMSDREIARVLGIRTNSVRQYLTRARRAVYQTYQENGYEKE